MFNINMPLLFKVNVSSYMFQSLRMAWRRTLNNDVHRDNFILLNQITLKSNKDAAAFESFHRQIHIKNVYK